MCRHLAWLGRPRSIASLVLERPHGLLQQSYAPRRQRRGTVNADGWGVGFFAPGSAVPRRWRSAGPLWSDASFASVAPVLDSGCAIAAVRSATVGMPVEASAAAPFLADGWLVSHNGVVDRTLLDVPAATAESACDSALLAALLARRGPQRLGEVVAEVGGRDPAARLNVLATDGRRVLATTWGDTLSLLRLEDGLVLASEPWDDDPRWEDVPDRHLVEATPDGLAVTQLAAAP
ncbi:ergothioneine biosynthesis protein EgtC [Vallicoccus soli]|uniref:Gamma-glutamyl-hercynylcysteine sulfoxide hydrolase n=1 Tax=Vallicoccus soli TaxID=2339232 RepID=A0A3A3ZLR3_9ACTN|nr:ergothioneine biosynthesis protein EgtC [Vallicoccus soli]RJK97162.1 ergothioneine biosynthesis protein EgtC [Vallicoccus soli]